MLHFIKLKLSRPYPSLKPHILFHSIMVHLFRMVCQISGILKLLMTDSHTIPNLIEFARECLAIFQGIPYLKLHIWFYSNGLAIWQGLSDTTHNKGNYRRYSAILNLIGVEFFQSMSPPEAAHFVL